MKDWPVFTGNFPLLMSLLNKAGYDVIIEMVGDEKKPPDQLYFDIEAGKGVVRFKQ